MRYRRSDRVAWRQVGDETVVVQLDRKRMLGLNEAGGNVWQALGEERDFADLVRVLSDRDEPMSRLLLGFLRDLEREGAVSCDRPSGTTGELPAAVVGAPAVVWREEITRFAGRCSLLPGQSPICDSGSTRS